MVYFLFEAPFSIIQFSAFPNAIAVLSVAGFALAAGLRNAFYRLDKNGSPFQQRNKLDDCYRVA